MSNLPPLEAPWIPIEQAPRDGTLLILAIEPEGRQHPLSDSADYTLSFGFNEFDDSEIDRWQFMGYYWDYDQIVDGVGRPRYYQLAPKLRSGPKEMRPCHA